MSLAARKTNTPSGSSGAPQRVQHVIQGECAVSDDENVVLSTVLGSCIAACLRDPVAGVGGMNHFLLPDSEATTAGSQSYGTFAMECLVNGLLKKGASRGNLEAKIFGGASLMNGISDIGARNTEFIRQFLTNEGISCVAESVGGNQARRLKYWPVAGLAKQKLLSTTDEVQEVRQPIAPIPQDSGDLDLF